MTSDSEFVLSKVKKPNTLKIYLEVTKTDHVILNKLGELGIIVWISPYDIEHINAEKIWNVTFQIQQDPLNYLQKALNNAVVNFVEPIRRNNIFYIIITDVDHKKASEIIYQNTKKHIEFEKYNSTFEGKNHIRFSDEFATSDPSDIYNIIGIELPKDRIQKPNIFSKRNIAIMFIVLAIVAYTLLLLKYKQDEEIQNMLSTPI